MMIFLLNSFEILSALLLWVNLSCLQAEQVDRTIGQFVHTSWLPKDGAPGNVYALAQTTDGFLWLGTMQGLYRFDGITFERCKPESGPAFPSSFITSLLALPNGDLWIGFRDKGVSRLRGGRNTNYAKSDGLPSGRVAKLVQDRDGTIWAGTEGGLARFDHDQWQRVGSDWDYPGGRAAALFLDHRGTLWVASEKAVLFLPPGSRKFQTSGIEIGQAYQIVESPGGTLWMAETTRSVRPIFLPENQHVVEPEIKVGSVGILFDDDGSLWITSIGDGMRRVPFPDRLNGQKIGEYSGAIESFTAKDGLTSDYLTCILKDREGSIWVGTSAGLDRFRRGALVPILLPAKFTLKALVAGDDGDIWVGAESSALARIEGNTLSVKPASAILYGLRDPRGTIWFLDTLLDSSGVPFYRVLRLDQGKLTVFAKLSADIHGSLLGTVMAVDRLGTLWVGNGPHSLFFLKNGHWERFETPPAVAGKRARVTFTDASGRVWFGFTDSTILIINGTNVQTFSAGDGIQAGSVMAITGRDGHIWIGGEGGLAVWEGNRFRAVVPADSDAFHGVSAVQEDSGGNLFLSEQRGVLFIPQSEVSKILKDPSARAQYQVFDVRDGLPGAVQQTLPYPTAIQGTDGRIWFSASAGVAWINPAHVSRNLLPPPVVIRSITANGIRYTSSAGLKLPPRTRDLTIDYTALSLMVPERVRFRYKLEGQDADWRDVVNERQVHYTNLAPGHHTFRVIACNNDNVWDKTGTSLDFSIAPTYYQTTWFRLCCAAAFLLSLWGAYQLRVRQLARQFAIGLEERVSERTRIARELHDTLLQSFQALMFQFQAARNMVPRRPEDAVHALDDAILATAQAIAEGRDAISDLRPDPAAQRDLAELLNATGREMAVAGGANGHSPTFRVIVEGKPRTISVIVQDEVYRIARETIRNAFRHAAASRIEVEIHYDEQQLRLRIRDDGKGMDPKILAPGERSGHWGIPGIRERAQRIGSRLEFWTEEGAGTEIELSLPAAIAYEKARDRRRFRLFRRAGNDGQRS